VINVAAGEVDLGGTGITIDEIDGFSDIASGALVKMLVANPNEFYVGAGANKGILFATTTGGTFDLNGFNTNVVQLASTAASTTGIVTNNSATADAILTVGGT